MDDSDQNSEFDFDPVVIERLPWLETPLDPTEPCIRILKLHEGANNSPVTCSLKVVSLDDNPDYETLSYVWGDARHTKSITVGGGIFNATENLFDFLSCLRQPAAVRLLWADAICIDQTNDDEKGRQIGLMTRIYRQAKEAHIWFGKFTASWTSELKGDEADYTPACELTPDQWRQAEEGCREELGQYQRAGGKPQKQQELRGLDDPIIFQALDVLDRVAAGSHFKEFPLFIINESGDSTDRYVMNKHWLTIHDCIRWLLSRPWWSRVWTLQEAVLPEVDPIIHASPYSFRMSRLLNGRSSFLSHSNRDCCKYLGRLFNVAYFRSLSDLSVLGERAHAVHQHREAFSKEDPPWISLSEVIDSARGRKATAPKDHFFGTLGLLHPEIQDQWFTTFGYSSTATEAFSQCSHLLYDSCKSLSMLGEARGVQSSKISNLPSWALDLSAELPFSYDGNKRWELFNASLGSCFENETVTEWAQLAGPDLVVKVIPIGKVGACAEKMSAYDLEFLGSTGEPDMLWKHISNWQNLFADCAGVADLDRFWRTAFMDRNIWRYYMHKRNPLPAKRLSDITLWWRSWSGTGDHLDLTNDTRYGEERKRGDYHYRALKLNFDKHRFFCTNRGEPGMGPMEAQPSDEIFILQGCQAPAVLRRRVDSDGFLFVGLCFVDGWMYGRAMTGRPDWQTVTLY